MLFIKKQPAYAGCFYFCLSKIAKHHAVQFDVSQHLSTKQDIKMLLVGYFFHLLFPQFARITKVMRVFFVRLFCQAQKHYFLSNEAVRRRHHERTSSK